LGSVRRLGWTECFDVWDMGRGCVEVFLAKEGGCQMVGDVNGGS
jgi:hypothetical protein